MPFHLKHRPVIRPLLRKIFRRRSAPDFDDDAELLCDHKWKRLTLSSLASTQHDDLVTAWASYQDNLTQPELVDVSSRSSSSAHHEFTASELERLGYSFGSGVLLPQNLHSPSSKLEVIHEAAQHFRFMDLPGEIRNVVYKYALNYKEPRYFDWSGSYDPEHETENLTVGLLRVCKEIHEEATPFLYDNRRFVVHVNIGCEDLEWCMTQFPPATLNRIKDLTVLLRVPYKPQAMEQPINLGILNRMKALKCVAYACIIIDGPDARHNAMIAGNCNRNSLYVQGLVVALLSATPDAVKIYWVNAHGPVPGMISCRELQHCQNRYQALQGAAFK